MTPQDIMKPFGVEIDLDTGEMPGATHHLVRLASDMRGYYQDAASLQALIAQGNPLHYEVFEAPVPQQAGQLMFCLSKLQPGQVGTECFMTKGHYHLLADTAEIYLCLRGEGYVLMRTNSDQGAWEKLKRGRMVYVPPLWGHRSVNTGGEPLVSFCVYPGDAGHNYGDIEEEGFPKRVFKIGGRIDIR
jgi:glucose-6-phosphate isomerase